MKVSVVCTLKNEESSVKELLDSLLTQTKPPDEVVIVDGGSTDRTVEIINSYIANGAPIKLIVQEGANIAEGRNIAIKNSKYDIIASTDAGCRLDKDWLRNLIKPFEDDASIDVVSGWYEAYARNEFEEYVAELTFPKLGDVLRNPDKFLPSSRSIAFKKSAWEKVGGYPEWLTLTAEDTLFDLNLKRAGCRFTFAPAAVVYWRVRPNLRSVFRQSYLYARGDGEARLYKNHLLLWSLYLGGITLLVLGSIWKLSWPLLSALIMLYLLRPSLRLFKKKRSIKTFMWVPPILLAVQIGAILGFLRGLLSLKKNKEGRLKLMGKLGISHGFEIECYNHL